MPAVKTDKIRTIALLGHGGSGKTSIAEAMLFLAKASDRLGVTTSGNTVCDYDPEEIKRGFSISLATANYMWNGTKVNVIDTPGFLDFVGEVLAGLRVADSAVISVDAKSGIQVGTELAWDNATACGLPKAFFINKSDDPEAAFGKVLDSMIETFGGSVCPVVVPVGAGQFVDLLSMKKYTYDAKGARIVSDAEADSTIEGYREKLFEAIAATDDELMMKYFDGEEITKEEASAALHAGIVSGSITPVYSGSAAKLWGIDALIEGICDSFPSHLAKKVEKVTVDGKEEEFEIKEDGEPSLYVFKTTVDQFGRTTYFKVMSGTLTNAAALENINTGADEKAAHFYTVVGKKQTEVDTLSCGDIGAITKLSNTNSFDTLTATGKEFNFVPATLPEPFYGLAVLPKVKGEEDKIAQGINKILDEDKTLRFINDPETKQLVLYGLGDMQLDVVLSKLKARSGVTVETAAPKVAYRETIRKKVSVEGKHKKQTGGHGQYGHVKITFGPGEDLGLTFTQSVVGGTVPKGYYPAVEKGLLEAMQKGVLAGYPVVNLAADLYDGSYHEVDSNELSFKMAASLAYKAGLPLANPVILEPVGDLKVTIPEGMVGDVMGDINGKRRGSVLGMNAAAGKKGYTTIEAEVPKGEMLDYTIALRAMTQGKGSYTFYATRYEQVPEMIAQKIIAEAKANATEE